ncbi:hypothetical protein PIROE2DRAFT_12628 [Piromyces sp. E2]|nr:hypothetical protein PIROE2DRAFT_12628 [Piromyces sp. E2]|eukprot:OUM61375.1 hypothetical protein PIROE2DRAFT_12628 [Piromyces sp. E2]
MEFGINKNATMIVRPDSPSLKYKKGSYFLFSISITDCYTYFDIPLEPSNKNKVKKVQVFVKYLRRKSIKAEYYNRYRLEEANEYLKLYYDYLELSLYYQWLMKSRCGYKLNSRVTRTAQDCQ